jgi:CRISPR-associated protein Csd2
MSETVGNRHDILILFDVTQGNPNGDPDAGNMPRIDPNTNKGIISDVCLKRKVRNYVELFPPNREADATNGFNIMVTQGAVLERTISDAMKTAKEGSGKDAPKETLQEKTVKWLCRQFYDIRAFGGVLSVGEEAMKGSAFGQVRGPVQFTFAQSFHPITPLEITITRCAVTKEEDKEKERTMGQKHIVPYGLYAGKAYVSPPFAERTGFTTADLDLLFEALNHMFDHDRSAARGEMVVRGIYDFEHVGTQAPNNAEQNKREARLGCYHAHKLLEGINVKLRHGKEFPASFSDYEVTSHWTEETLPKGVVMHLRHEQPVRTLRPKA